MALKSSAEWLTTDWSSTQHLLLTLDTKRKRATEDASVLVVVDRPLFLGGDGDEGSDGPSDPMEQRALGHDAAVTFSNMVGYTVTRLAKERKDIRTVQVLCACLPTGEKWEQVDTRGRLIGLVRRLKPQAVMLAGQNVAFSTAEVTRDSKSGSLYKDYGRLREFRASSFSRTGGGRSFASFKGIVTMPLDQLVDPDPPIKGSDGGGAVNLIGDFCDHLEAAILRRNRIDITKDVEKRADKYVVVDTMAKFKTFLKALNGCRTPAIDTEGDNIKRLANRILTMQFYLPGNATTGRKSSAFFLPMEHKETPWTPKEFKRVKDGLREYFESGRSSYTIWHNAKFDIVQLFNSIGVRWYGHRVYDTMVGEHAIEENLKYLPKQYIRAPYSLGVIEARYGYQRPGMAIDKEDRSGMADKPLKDIAPYGMLDAITTYLIHRTQMQTAKRLGHAMFKALVVDQGGSTMRAIARMEYQGMRLDVGYLTEMAMDGSPVNKVIEEAIERFKTSKAAQRVNKRLASQAGHTATGLFGKVKTPWVLNLQKDEHKTALFLDELKLAPVSFSRKTNKPKLDKFFLAAYKGSVDEVAWMAEYKSMYTLKHTFIDSLLELLLTDPDASRDSHIRSSYSISKVATGRLSSSEPNLQNIATRDKIAKLLKRAFITDETEGLFIFVTLKADLSAHEINMLANVAGDKAILTTMQSIREAKRRLRLASDDELEEARRRFARDGDLHIANVKTIYGMEVDSEHELRTSVKSAAFGAIYAMSAPSLGAKIVEPKVKSVKEKINALDKALVAYEEGTKDKKAKAGAAKARAELATLTKELEELSSKDFQRMQGQDVLTRMFAAWPEAKDWLADTRDAARSALETLSPSGRKRHLWPYLHANPRVQDAMDRKGPNAVIQGIASEVACVAAHLGGKFEWDTFVKHGLPLKKRLANLVHDSQSSQVPLHLLPVAAYVTEHSMTSMTIPFYRKRFGFDILSPSGIDIEYGFNDAEMLKWKDMRFDTMREHFAKLFETCKAPKRVQKAALHNLKVVQKLREAELRKDPYKMLPQAKDPRWWAKAIRWNP